MSEPSTRPLKPRSAADILAAAQAAKTLGLQQTTPSASTLASSAHRGTLLTPLNMPHFKPSAPSHSSEPQLPSYPDLSWQHTLNDADLRESSFKLFDSSRSPSDHFDNNRNSFIEELTQISGMEHDEANVNDIEPLSTVSEPSSSISDKPKRISKLTRLQVALAYLRRGRLSPTDLLVHVLDTHTPENDRYRVAMYKEDGRLGEILDMIMEDSRGCERLRIWMEQHVIDTTCAIVDKEMDAVKMAFSMKLDHVTPDYISQWTVETTTGDIVQNCAPVLYRLLIRAAQDDKANSKNSKKRPEMMCNILIAQLSKSRSVHSLSFQAVFALFLWSTGCQRQTIEALHRCGLSLSYVSIIKLRETLANHCIELATNVAAGPHVVCWDNINISTSIFVEQRKDAPSKVQSGTFAILYKISADLTHLSLAPIMGRDKVAGDLGFDLHIKPTTPQMQSTIFQLKVLVVRVLTAFSKPFLSYASSPQLQHKPRYLLALRKTATYPLRITTINEATVEGTIKVWHDVYTQTKRDPSTMEDLAVPSINDQLTNSRVRGAKALQIKEPTLFLQLANLQLAHGLFHKCLNLVWALLKTHQGAIDQLGSLKYFFALLEKTRLGNDKPDYHTLLTAVMQILHGTLLEAWRRDCGFSGLDAFAASKPTPEALLKIAEQILAKYVAPMDECPSFKVPQTHTDNTCDDEISDTASDLSDSSNSHASSDSISELSQDSGPHATFANPQDDCAHRNIHLLLRDLLYLAELVRAISDGDWGRIEDILGQLTMMFRGAGSNNYSTELLHFVRNLKIVWGDNFANIMRDCMLVNPSGLVGHWMGTDLNIEHLIGYLKFLFASKGLYAGWDRLGDISAAVDYLQKIKKEVGEALGGYKGKTHTTPDTSHLVWKVANDVRDAELLIFKLKRDRYPNDCAKPVVDILMKGEQKLKSASLKTFNSKIHILRSGQYVDEEVDDIPWPDYAEVVFRDDDDSSEGENSQ